MPPGMTCDLLSQDVGDWHKSTRLDIVVYDMKNVVPQVRVLGNSLGIFYFLTHILWDVKTGKLFSKLRKLKQFSYVIHPYIMWVVKLYKSGTRSKSLNSNSSWKPTFIIIESRKGKVIRAESRAVIFYFRVQLRPFWFHTVKPILPGKSNCKLFLCLFLQDLSHARLSARCPGRMPRRK